MRRIILYVVFTILSIMSNAQDRNYFLDAEQAFQKSEYAKAAELYRASFVITGIDTDTKQKICKECVEAQRNARERKNASDIEAAKGWYEKLLDFNPDDAEASAFIQAHSIPEWQRDCWIIHLDKDEYLAVQKNVGKRLTYEAAVAAADGDTLGGLSEWHLPTVDELKAICKKVYFDEGNDFWCADKGTKKNIVYNITNNIVYANGVMKSSDTSAATKEISYSHQTFSPSTGRVNEVEDKYKATNDNERAIPITVNKYAFLKVRKLKGDYQESLSIENVTSESGENTNSTKQRTVVSTATATLHVNTHVTRSSYCK